MIVTNYSSLRKDLKKYCGKVIDDWEAIIITRKNDKNVVLMSLIENLYIMSNKKYCNKLLKRKEKAENIQMHGIIEVE